MVKAVISETVSDATGMSPRALGRALSYAFLLTAVIGGIFWLVATMKWSSKVYHDENVINAMYEDTNGVTLTGASRKDYFSYQLLNICFQAVVVSILLYFVFKHH